MNYCRYCGAEIEWLQMPDGRFIPANPIPVFFVMGEGSERFYDEEQGVLTGRRARPEEIQTKEQKNDMPQGFVPHWRTCQARR